MGVAIGLAAFFTWQAIKSKNENTRTSASLSYQSVLEQLAANENRGAEINADDQVQTLKVMPYELMNELILARLNADEQNVDKAIEHLKIAITESDDAYFKELASVLWHVYCYLTKTSRSIDGFRTWQDKQYPDWFLARGDAQLALNNTSDARKDYTKALELYPPMGFHHQLVSMQLADLPE